MTRPALLSLTVALCLFWSPVKGDETSLLDARADQIHSNGKTALMLAAKNANRARIKDLIGRGADVNESNNNGGSPIMYAALSGDVRTVALLLRYGADANAPAKNGWTALMIASAKGYREIARTLLEQGAEPNKPDVYAWTPLMRAVYENRPGIVHLLLNQDTTGVNQRGENGVTALHLASVKGQADIVRRLLEAGADTDAKDDLGRTASDLARENNQLAVEKLISRGISD